MVLGPKSHVRATGRASAPALAAAALVPAVVLALAYAPLAADNNFVVENNSAKPTGEWKLWWLLLMVCAAPLAAMAFNWRWPVTITSERAFLTAAPLIAVAVGLIWVDVWLGGAQGTYPGRLERGWDGVRPRRRRRGHRGHRPHVPRRSRRLVGGATRPPRRVSS